MEGITPQVRERREAVVRAHIAAENAGDVNGTLATFHHACYNVVPMGAICDGEPAVRELVGGLVRAFPDFHFEAIVIHHAERAVIVEGRMTGTQRAEWAGLPPRGKRMEVRAACVFDFDGDRLVNETVYFDFATFQRQLTAA